MTEVFKHEMVLDHDRIERANFDLPMHWIHVHDNAPGWVVPNHWHEELEVSFTVKGELRGFNINGETFNTQAGDVLIIRPGEVHSLVSQPPDPERDILTIFFDSQLLLQDVENIKQLKFHPHANAFSIEETEKLTTDLMALYTYITDLDAQPERRLALKHLMYDLLYRIVTSFSYVGEEQNEQLNDLAMSSDFMQEVVQYVKTHIHEELRVQDLADSFNISPSYLTRSFKRYVDRTPMAYIQMLRLNVATQYLMNTDYAVQYVADMSGFGSLRSFERAFKEQYNSTPTEYRRERRIRF